MLNSVLNCDEAKEQLRKLSHAVEHSPASVLVTDLDGTIEYVNARFVKTSGYRADEVIGSNPRFLKSELTPPERYQNLWDTITKGQEWHGELVNHKKNGDAYWEWCSISPVRLSNGVITHYIAINEDITSRKKADEKLLLADNVFTHTSEGIMVTDSSGTVIKTNDAFSKITGYSSNEILGCNPRILRSGRHGQDFYSEMWRSLTENGHWQGEIWNRRKGGETYTGMLTISALRNAQGDTTNYVGLFSDITVQKRQQQQLKHITHYDALTGLPNRVLLSDRLYQAASQANRYSQQLIVTYIDLDGFQTINDNYGHEVGDQLLLAVASRMKQTLQEGDTFSHLGGDEFVAVFTGVTSIKECKPMLTRLLEAVSQPVLVDELTLQITASIGVTIYPQTEEVNADQLLRQADQAMYQAKLAGKNQYHLFDAEHDRSIRGHHESIDRIKQALDDHEFILYYQPKVNMRTGEVIGAEALIRWQHPEQGLLQPATFLPVIENHPLFIELGEWVIDTAVAQLDAWHAAGLKITVSVNVGALQLQQFNFTKNLCNILAAHPTVDPTYLELEVLETSALEDIEHVSLVMESCRMIGVNFSLDDFGTGYSSLTYLKRLPAAKLKMDQSFVCNMLDDPEDLAILEGVLGLALAFRRQVIAEGVETRAHGEMLLQLGCELAQGFGISPPMPASEFIKWSRIWKPHPSWMIQRTLRREDLPLLFASVEHRAWIKGLEEYLKGERTFAPPQGHHQCRFGNWMDGEGGARYGKHPAFLSIEVLHQQIHSVAYGMLEQQNQGNNQDAMNRLEQLYKLRDTLLEQLLVLLDENRRRSTDD